MALTLKSRAAVRFEITDDDVETTVTLLLEDDEAVLVRKMRRIIALVEGGQSHPDDVREFLGPQKVLGRAAEPEPAPGNGWASMAPELPEDRKGEWEIIQSGEET